MRRILAVLAFIGLFAVSASAVKAQSTGDLLASCHVNRRVQSFIDAKGDLSHFSLSEMMDYTKCLYYIDGLGDGFEGASVVTNGTVYTWDFGNTTNNQIITAFVTFADAHPETAKDPAALTIGTAAFAAELITSKPIGALVPLGQKPSSAPKVAPDGRQTAQNIKSVQK
jgi:hypothetical protein